MGRWLLLPQRRCFVAFAWGSVSPFLHAECSPLPPNRKAFVDSGTGGNCTGLAWQGDRLSSWLPVGHRVPAVRRHGHSRDHLSQRSSLDPIQNRMPRTALKAPAISCLRTSVTGHHSTEKNGTGNSLGPSLALTPSSSLSGGFLRPSQTPSIIQTSAGEAAGSLSSQWVVKPHCPFWLGLPSFASQSQPQPFPSWAFGQEDLFSLGP